MLEQRGIDTKRTVVVPVATVQEFRTQWKGDRMGRQFLC